MSSFWQEHPGTREVQRLSPRAHRRVFNTE